MAPVLDTHSPFLVDPDRLDRVRAVYVKADGTTGVSADLRAPEAGKAQSRSVYPVHAALGLSVSETLLQGCQPVIVEGPSDLIYLSALKTLMVGSGGARPLRELLFMPAGGVKGVGALVPIVAGKEEALPFVLVDSDGAGKGLAEKLRQGAYAAAPGRLLAVGDFIEMPGAEVEDLLPPQLMARVVARWLRAADEDFEDAFRPGQPIIGQIEQYAKRNGQSLEPGWKVELAKKVRPALLALSAKGIPAEWQARWAKLFAALAE
ncbi:hypothetical protein EJ065_2787 [Corallococcus coralloides]|uniref:Toprim domain-containing protein n=2 Tax=Corallococcus coralloides TaxID=184914 RepID=A0A410RR22_CORCK|nr:hypothetical protein EJ065_2787 [Corallococcus coralloides]